MSTAAPSSVASPVPAAADAPSSPSRSRAKILLPVLLFAAASAVTAVYVAGKGKESTDDAQVEGHVANVAARVNGQVKAVLVKDNQPVKAGDLLVQLDDRDVKAKLAAAKADLAAAKANLTFSETQVGVIERTAEANLQQAHGGLAQASAGFGTTRAGIDQARADLAAADSRRTLSRLELDRAQKLVADGAVSPAEYDTKKALFDQAEAAVSQARARLESAQANVGNSTGTMETARGRFVAAQAGPAQVESARAQLGVARARVEQAQAALEQAELNVSYAEVRALVSGVVARRTVEVGQMVSTDRPLMAIVPLDDVWVVANYKEDQAAKMQPGQAVRVKVDAFGGRVFNGHVDSLSAGTGSRFSLLPPDNASGNFTKVVQRVPVLVRLEAHPDVLLRPGMSAYVTVVTQ